MATATNKQTLNAEPRTESGKGFARRLRAEGKVPGTLYGHGLDGAQSVILDPEAMYDLLTTRKRQNIVFSLELEGQTFSDVMVKDYQIDPVRRELQHADLIAIDPDKRVSVTVPVDPIGRPVGVRAGGRLQVVRGMIPVTCLPNEIPESIEHDVTKLKMGQAVLATELNLPEGLEPDWPVDFAVVRVAIPRGATVVDDEDEDEEGEASGEAAAEGEEA
jgi:large subunit ribosomal protein L25